MLERVAASAGRWLFLNICRDTATSAIWICSAGRFGRCRKTINLSTADITMKHTMRMLLESVGFVEIQRQEHKNRDKYAENRHLIPCFDPELDQEVRCVGTMYR
jgi:hypothetical protein